VVHVRKLYGVGLLEKSSPSRNPHAFDFPVQLFDRGSPKGRHTIIAIGEYPAYILLKTKAPG